MLGRPFSFDTLSDDRTQVFHGVLDEPAVDHVATLFRGEPAANLTIDLTDVDFLGSIAIGALVKAQLRAREFDRELRILTTERSTPDRVLSISGVPHVAVPVDLDLHGQ